MASYIGRTDFVIREQMIKEDEDTQCDVQTKHDRVHGQMLIKDSVRGHEPSCKFRRKYQNEAASCDSGKQTFWRRISIVRYDAKPYLHDMMLS